MAGALAGLKIVEVGELVSAPYAAKLMADMGAEVIKVERPGAGDPARRRGPFPGGHSHPEKSGLFLYLNANKHGVTLDIAQPEGFELLEALTADADVLIHNISPPEMDRLGFNYQRLAAPQPAPGDDLDRAVRLERGASRLARRGAHGLVVGRGLRAQRRRRQTIRNCRRSRPSAARPAFRPACMASVATMGAVYARLRGAGGQHVEVSGQESLASQIEMVFEYWPYMGVIATRLGRKPLQPLETMECKDGWIYVCCVEEHQWRNFVSTLWVIRNGPTRRFSPIGSSAPRTGRRWKFFCANGLVSRRYWIFIARRRRGACRSLRSRRWATCSAPSISRRGDFLSSCAIRWPAPTKYPGAPLKYGATPWQIRMPAPALGQHNGEIFGARLGLDPQRLRALQAQRSDLDGASGRSPGFESPTSPGCGRDPIAPCNWRIWAPT